MAVPLLGVSTRKQSRMDQAEVNAHGSQTRLERVFILKPIKQKAPPTGEAASSSQPSVAWSVYQLLFHILLQMLAHIVNLLFCHHA